MASGSPSAKFLSWPKPLPTAPMNTRGTAIAQWCLIKTCGHKSFWENTFHAPLCFQWKSVTREVHAPKISRVTPKISFSRSISRWQLPRFPVWIAQTNGNATIVTQHKCCCYLLFLCLLSAMSSELVQNVFACSTMHFLAIFILCKFSFWFYS